MKNTNKTLYNVVLTALFAAITTLLTMLHVPVGLNGGYVHVGDAMIYIAACFLPAPYAILAGAIGGGMADFISSAYAYILPTTIIKALITIPFSSKNKDKVMTTRNIISIFIAGIITIAGYYITDAVLFGGWVVALATLIPNLIQAVGSGIVFLVIGFALDKAGMKNRLQKINN